MSKSVLIIQEHLPHYRIPFFERLRSSLASTGVELQLIHGKIREARFVESALDWATGVELVRLGPMVWHRALKHCRHRDLIIAPQETKYLLSHLLQTRYWAGGPPFAFWGHGRNFQARNPNSPSERVKRFIAPRVHWWFAYNDLSARVVRDLGYPAERITSVGNAIDTSHLIERLKSVTEDELARIRTKLGLKATNVAVFTGGLYEHKRIEFLIEAALKIRERIPDFELLVIGDGPLRSFVARAAAHHPWIHDLGRQNDDEKVPYWALSKVLLMPGGVGLVVLDSFALGVPMITTDTHLHGPEIDYLRNNVNGLLVPCGSDSERYADEVIKLMRDPAALARLRDGAINSASEYSIERMVDNFTQGVMAALAAPRN